jgi:lysophospholipase L1-like esterase
MTQAGCAGLVLSRWPELPGPTGNYTFLFQGDSITDGNRSRNADWNHVLGHGYAYLIASRLWYDHPSSGFHFFNRGVSGNTVADLAARWQEDALDIRPQLISILVGINDVNSLFTGGDPLPAGRFRETYAGLLTRTRRQLPDTTIVLCEPFALPVGRVKDRWTEWSAEVNIRRQAVRQLAADFNTLFVPLQDDFDTACRKAPPEFWIWDGIHPMPGGHELIARKWIHTVRKHLPIF